MSDPKEIRDSVIRSLSAIGALRDAQFYADLFSTQEAEQFALIVVDPRCLQKTLLESLIGSIRILADLGLTPVLLVGILKEDVTAIRFQAQKLVTELESAKVKSARLDIDSYKLIDIVRNTARQGRIPILANTRSQKQETLIHLVENLTPGKVIFLQPSGGISRNGLRVPVINIDDTRQTNLQNLTPGQTRFIDLSSELLKDSKKKTVYVIASPLNLLQELFTVKGSGTMIRKGAVIKDYKSFRGIKMRALKASMESGFEKKVVTKISKWPVKSVLLEESYRGGAILTALAGMTYLSKFWVTKEAQGEGIARDIWDRIVETNDSFFWRSRLDNPFNDWYIRVCDGMQVVDGWRVFWRGLSPEEFQSAIDGALRVAEDFQKL